MASRRQLSKRRSQLAAVERRRDRAARVARVVAVGEPARRGQRGDVGERRVERVGVRDQADAADARGVDQHRAARQRDELAVRRGVPAAAVVAPAAGRP